MAGGAEVGRGGALARRLGTTDAVVLGLGSMIGAGVFSAFAPAARAARGWLPLAVLLAGAVAWLNATSSARLAAAWPVAGGTYAYATRWLSPAWGHLAGWAFVVGKTASCAAMAFTVAAYAVPRSGPLQRGVALLAVAAVVVLGTRGVQRGVALTRLLLAVALVALAVVLWVAVVPAAPITQPYRGGGGVLGVLQGAGFMFFAFAGYARVATLGEEVREPRRTIPRAIAIALALTVALYLALAVALLHVESWYVVAQSSSPLLKAAGAHPGVVPFVRVGAVAAASGALLGLLLGVSRVLYAMARDRHLPGWLTGVRHGVPANAETLVALVVAALVLVADLRAVIGFSAVTVLTYYAVTHLAASRMSADDGRPPRYVPVLGVAGCAGLGLTLPWPSVAAGIVMLGLGVVTYRVTERVRVPAR